MTTMPMCPHDLTHETCVLCLAAERDRYKEALYKIAHPNSSTPDFVSLTVVAFKALHAASESGGTK